MKSPRMHVMPWRTRSPYGHQWTEAVRHSMWCRLTYTCEVDGMTNFAQGLTADFCKTECDIRGNVLPAVGGKTVLTLYLLDRKPPLSFDGTITWRAGDYFGMHI